MQYLSNPAARNLVLARDVRSCHSIEFKFYDFKIAEPGVLSIDSFFSCSHAFSKRGHNIISRWNRLLIIIEKDFKTTLATPLRQSERAAAGG